MFSVGLATAGYI